MISGYPQETSKSPRAARALCGVPWVPWVPWVRVTFPAQHIDASLHGGAGTATTRRGHPGAGAGEPILSAGVVFSNWDGLELTLIELVKI